MDELRLPPRQAQRLAQFLVGRKRDVVAAIVDFGIERRHVSLADRAFAGRFIERLAEELTDDDRVHLERFARELGRDATNADDNAHRLTIACAAVARVYATEVGRSDDVARYLALRASALERIVLATQALTVREWVPEPAVRVAQSDLVVTLLSTLESHDEGTSAHSRAVGAWCAQLAKLLGMTTPMQEFVSTCGMVHDIGKLVTPTEILLKPGALDDAEWVVMRAHAAAGAQMLERIPTLRETAGVVRAHHERIDGRGYPDQLSGDGIPLPARMVAVADAFHSMISTRPYRQALSIPAAIQIIRDGRGTQWDSGVVDAMLDYIVPKTSKGAASIGYAVGGFNTSSYW